MILSFVLSYLIGVTALKLRDSTASVVGSTAKTATSFDASSSLLWAQFKLGCETKRIGLPQPGGPFTGPFTMWAWRNHGLCYEVEKLSELCGCQWREPRSDFLSIDFGAMEGNFNASRWALTSGQKCKELKFTVPGHSRSRHIQESEPRMIPCSGTLWETPLRRDWFVVRYLWQNFMDGRNGTTFENLNMVPESLWLYPIFMGPDRTAPFLSPATLNPMLKQGGYDNYCNLTDSSGNPFGDCGPGKEITAEWVDMALCQMGDDTAMVVDSVFVYNPKIGKDPRKSPPILSAQYTLRFVEGKWKIERIVGAASKYGSIPLEWLVNCNHWYDDNRHWRDDNLIRWFGE